MRFGPILPSSSTCRACKTLRGNPLRAPVLAASSHQELDMDLVMVGLTVAFFALSFAYIQTCSKL
ncbi:hypothetical protein [Tianweitania populi]|uniref:hypothetical protein n=1 Tax=Tianweitania populi TaxID=1607949 RepID=UPI00167A051A|nr:hypothetical protein [Tianweitania populi]